MQSPISIRAATPDDIDQLAVLFDLYRQFYGQPGDVELAREFIERRISQRESIIFVAQQAAGLIGFTQLYPTFCSVSAAPILVLYDLYILPGQRRRGCGRALMRAAVDYASTTHAVRLELATAKTNHAAQALYRSLGWTRDDAFDRYSLQVMR